MTQPMPASARRLVSLLACLALALTSLACDQTGPDAAGQTGLASVTLALAGTGAGGGSRIIIEISESETGEVQFVDEVDIDGTLQDRNYRLEPGSYDIEVVVEDEADEPQLPGGFAAARRSA